jgi:hypothetical protein
MTKLLISLVAILVLLAAALALSATMGKKDNMSRQTQKYDSTLQNQ